MAGETGTTTALSTMVVGKQVEPRLGLRLIALMVAIVSACLWLAGPRAQAASIRPTLLDLLSNADVVVRGHVVSITSFWSADHRFIESDVTLRVTGGIVGVTPPAIIIRTLGGYLPDEDIGMAASEAAHFTVGEDVLLFLRRLDGVYRVVHGEYGKYEIAASVAVRFPSGEAVPLSVLLERIGALRRGIDADGAPLLTLSTGMTFEPAAYVFSGQKWPGAAPMGEVFVVNVNSVHIGSNGSVDQFRQAILAAAAVWNAVPGAGFRFTYGGPTGATTTGYNDQNEIVFASDEYHTGALAQSQWWFNGNGHIVEADMWLNDAYVWDATGAPEGHEFDVQSVVMHELGHWLSLGHDGNPAAVMHGVMTAGSLKRLLHPNDMAGIQFIYPAPIAPTATPTTIPTPTPTTVNPIHLANAIRLWLPLLQR